MTSNSTLFNQHIWTHDAINWINQLQSLLFAISNSEPMKILIYHIAFCMNREKIYHQFGSITLGILQLKLILSLITFFRRTVPVRHEHWEIIDTCWVWLCSTPLLNNCKIGMFTDFSKFMLLQYSCHLGYHNSNLTCHAHWRRLFYSKYPEITAQIMRK